MLVLGSKGVLLRCCSPQLYIKHLIYTLRTRLGVIIDASPEISRSPCVRPAKGAQLAAANASSIKWCRPVRCWSLLTNPVVTDLRPAWGPCHFDPGPFSGSRLRWRSGGIVSGAANRRVTCQEFINRLGRDPFQHGVCARAVTHTHAE